MGGWSLGEKEMARKRGEISEGVKKKKGVEGCAGDAGMKVGDMR